MEPHLSQASNRLFGQPMFQILTRIKEMERQGKHIIHFEIGDPDFATPDNIMEAGCRAIRDGYTHYSPAVGEYSLRQAICQKNQEIRGFVPDMDQVIVTPGANIMIYFVVSCLMDVGDEIILPDPCFSTYISVARYCNVKPVFIKLREENQFRMSPKDVLNNITDKTRIVLVNSPHNPTGAVMTQDELEEIESICRERNIYLVTDEIYRWLNYRDVKNYSVSTVDKCKENVIVIDGFSKAYAMTGWRLGYGIAPAYIVDKMQLLLETVCSCVPCFTQYAGVEALLGNQDAIVRMREIYNSRRNTLVKGLNEIEGISCVQPEGAFYAFPNIENTGLSGREFAERALYEANVGLVSGEDFGDGGRGYVRLCYATSEENILEGVDRLKRFVRLI